MKVALLLVVLGTLGCMVVQVPPEAVWGTVRDRDGAPIAGATVALRMAIVHDWGLHGLLLELNRTRPDGSYSFNSGSNATLHFPGDRRVYWVVAAHRDHALAMTRFTESLENPVDLVLDRPGAEGEPADQVCRYAAATMRREEYRRLAEFHFAEATRCDAYEFPGAAP